MLAPARSAFGLIFLAATALPLSSPFYEELVAAHPYSAPGALEKTPDGRWLLVGEGGSIADLDASLESTFEAPPEQVKRVPVGFHGVAVLRFDPQASGGSRPEHVHTIPTPGTASGMSFREVMSVRQLMVADGSAGFRIFGRPQ